MRTHLLRLTTLLLCTLTTPCVAGIRQDLKSCAASSGAKSAAACTRVLKSGRLPKRQRYIAYFNRGWSNRNAGKYKKALADFTTASKLNPRYADTFYSRSVVRHDLGDNDGATQDLDKYISLKNDTWESYYKRSLMLRRLGKPEEALADLDTAETLDPPADKLAVAKALVLSDLGDLPAALKYADQAISTTPDSASAYYARATVLFRQHRNKDAQQSAEKALLHKKQYAAAFLLLGQILEDLEKYDAAKARYQQAVATRAKSIEELYARDEARSRLALISDTSTPNEPTDEPPKKSVPAEVGCRKFVPSAGTTIEVECDD